MKYLLSLMLVVVFCNLGPAQTPSPDPTPELPKIYTNDRHAVDDERRVEATARSSNSDVIRINTKLIVRSLSVTDEKGAAVADLQPSDFELYEDGVPQSIDVFSAGEFRPIPRSFVLVIDYHGFQAPYLEATSQAAKLLVEIMKPTDELAIVASDSRILADFSTDKDLLKRTLDSIVSVATCDLLSVKRNVSGDARNLLELLPITKGTALGTGFEFEALILTLNRLAVRPNRRNVVIFQGDGNEVLWLRAEPDQPYRISRETRENSGLRYVGNSVMRDFGFSKVVESVENSQTTIYSIAVGPRMLDRSKRDQRKLTEIAFQDYYRKFGLDSRLLAAMRREFVERDAEIRIAGQTAMKLIAEKSGGATYFLESPDDAETIYMNIVNAIENRYVLGYYTKDELPMPSRNVTITLKNHPDLTLKIHPVTQ